VTESVEIDLPPAVPGRRRGRRGRAGRLGFYVAGDGPPLLLLHSINAAASAYEIRPIFEHFATRRRVYAPDLPGFGISERSRRVYDVGLYVDAIHDLLDEIAGELGPAPIDALALSLTSEFLARAATERPEAFRTLALLTPTGFDARSEGLREPEGSTREVPFLHAVLTGGPWGRWLYALLTQPAVIRYFLRRTWGSEDIDPGLAAYDERTAAEPGAEHAPFAFLAGRLFSKDIRNVYEALPHSVWLPHGTRGDFRDFSGADWARRHERWTVEAFDTGALPHFEQPERFLRSYEAFLATWADGQRAGA